MAEILIPLYKSQIMMMKTTTTSASAVVATTMTAAVSATAVSAATTATTTMALLILIIIQLYHWARTAFILRGWQPHIEERPEALEILLSRRSVP